MGWWPHGEQGLTPAHCAPRITARVSGPRAGGPAHVSGAALELCPRASPQPPGYTKGPRRQTEPPPGPGAASQRPDLPHLLCCPFPNPRPCVQSQEAGSRLHGNSNRRSGRHAQLPLPPLPAASPPGTPPRTPACAPVCGPGRPHSAPCSPSAPATRSTQPHDGAPLPLHNKGRSFQKMTAGLVKVVRGSFLLGLQK